MKRLLHIIIVICMLTIFTVPTEASELEFTSSRLWDEADLLSESEESAILSSLDAVSEKYGSDIVVVMVDSIGEMLPKDYADQFFDIGGYGPDGTLMLVSMEYRDIAVYSYGNCRDIIGEYEIDGFFNALTGYFSDGDYEGGCGFFVNECEYYLYGDQNGFPFDYGTAIIISLIVCIISAFAVTSYHKGKLKSVAADSRAQSYVRQGSMNMTLSNDIFLYRNVTRIRKPTNNSSGGSRSSGGSFGGSVGRSGKF